MWYGIYQLTEGWLWIARTTQHPHLNMCACSVMSYSFVTSWTVARQAPLSLGFLRQEYWSGLPFPPAGESSWPKDRTHLSCIVGGILHHYAASRHGAASFFYCHICCNSCGVRLGKIASKKIPTAKPGGGREDDSGWDIRCEQILQQLCMEISKGVFSICFICVF